MYCTACIEICFVFTIHLRGLCHVVSLDKGLVIFCSFLSAAVTADSCEDLYVAVLETIKDCLTECQTKSEMSTNPQHIMKGYFVIP